MNRTPNETDEQYLERLINLPDFDKTVFKRYLLEDCLKSLNSIKHLNNEHVNKVIDLIEKWLNDPTKVTEEQFLAASYYTPDSHRSACAAASAASSSIPYWVAHWSIWTIVYSSCYEEELITNKSKQYIRFAKSLILKPTLPKSFISYLLNSKTEEELNVFLIDYAQEHDLPDIRNYISFLYEKPYSHDLILNNPELKTLL